MEIITIVLSALLGVVFVAGGVQKLRAQAQLAGTLEALGVAPPMQRTIGVLEVLGGVGVALGLFVQPLGIAAGAALAALMVGALVYHLRAHDSAKNSMGPVVMFVVAGLVTALQIAVV